MFVYTSLLGLFGLVTAVSKVPHNNYGPGDHVFTVSMRNALAADGSNDKTIGIKGYNLVVSDNPEYFVYNSEKEVQTIDGYCLVLTKDHLVEVSAICPKDFHMFSLSEFGEGLVRGTTSTAVYYWCPGDILSTYECAHGTEILLTVHVKSDEESQKLISEYKRVDSSQVKEPAGGWAVPISPTQDLRDIFYKTRDGDHPKTYPWDDPKTVSPKPVKSISSRNTPETRIPDSPNDNTQTSSVVNSVVSVPSGTPENDNKQSGDVINDSTNGMPSVIQPTSGTPENDNKKSGDVNNGSTNGMPSVTKPKSDTPENDNKQTSSDVDSVVIPPSGTPGNDNKKSGDVNNGSTNDMPSVTKPTSGTPENDNKKSGDVNNGSTNGMPSVTKPKSGTPENDNKQTSSDVDSVVIPPSGTPGNDNKKSGDVNNGSTNDMPSVTKPTSGTPENDNKQTSSVVKSVVSPPSGTPGNDNKQSGDVSKTTTAHASNMSVVQPASYTVSDCGIVCATTTSCKSFAASEEPVNHETTTTITFTTCSNDMCYQTALPATIGPTTVCIGSTTTTYTTWCPVTTEEIGYTSFTNVGTTIHGTGEEATGVNLINSTTLVTRASSYAYPSMAPTFSPHFNVAGKLGVSLVVFGVPLAWLI